jgi:transmembrane sensor
MHSNSMETSISDEAVEWFTKVHSGQATPEDFRRFEKWRKLSPLHAEAYADVEEFWTLLDKPAQHVFEQEEERAQRQTRTALPIRKPPVHAPPFALGLLKRRAVAGLSLTAALLLFAWLPGFLRFWNSDYHTGWGERRELTLEDGSQITLNTHTALSVEFSRQQRVIRLAEGEAYFQVSHNPNRPFIVITDFGATRVTGTAFDVYKQNGQMTVTVSEGHVRVYRDGDEKQAAELDAGKQTTRNIYGAGPVVPADARQVSAWKNGLLVFNMRPLAEVIDELNRYLPGKIMIADPRIRKRVVSGAFDLSNPQDILGALEKNLNLHALNLSSAALTMLYQPGF